MSSFNSTPFSSNKKAKRSEDTDTKTTPGWSRGLFGSNTPAPKPSGQTNGGSSLNINGGGSLSLGNVASPSPWRQQRTSGVASRPSQLMSRQPQVQFLDRVEAQAPPPPPREAAAAATTTVVAPLPTRKRPHAKVGVSKAWMSLGPAARKTTMAPDIIKRIAAERNERNMSAASKLSGDLSLISMNIGKSMNSNLSRYHGVKRFKSSHFSEPSTSQSQETAENRVDFSSPQESSTARNESQGTGTVTLDPPYNLGAIPKPVVGTAAGSSPKGAVLINPGTMSSREVKGIAIPPPVSADDDQEDQKATTQGSAAKFFEPEDTDQKWKCTLCGFDENLDHIAKCAKCDGYGRASEGPTTSLWDKFASQKNQWKCLACSCLNDSDRTICLSCEVPKGKDGKEEEKEQEKKGDKNDAPAPTGPSFSFMSDTSAPVKDASGQQISFGFPSAPAQPHSSPNAAPTFGFSAAAAAAQPSNTSTNVPAPVANPPTASLFGAPAPSSSLPSGQASTSSGTPEAFSLNAPAPSNQPSGQASTSSSAPTPAASNPQSDTPSTGFSFPTAPADSSASKTTSSKSSFGFPTPGAAAKAPSPKGNGGKSPHKSDVPTDPLTGKPLSSAEAASLSQFQSNDEQGRAKKRRGRDDESPAKQSATDMPAQKRSSSFQFPTGAGTAAETGSTS
eukprot:scaffold2357_cov167-Amphora_coffeaeformis.AAC.1